MAEIDPVILELRAEMGRYRAEVKQSADQTARNFARMERDTQRLEKQMLRSSTAIQGSFRTLGASLGTYFSGRELVGLIDGFTRLQNSLKVAGLEGQQLEAVQGRLLDLSTRYGVSIESLAELYGNASQTGKELGASQEQILKLTEATSQALLITGTSSQQASGAILGLNQALASGTVRAEEFNQINEGGLRPLLQAAAASEKYGGSVAKLRAAVLDGKVSSQEFYQAILAGSAQLEGQASKATLTLQGAFNSLTSALTVYIGQAAETSGVTAALAGAMQLLADNLDKIIPALAVIGVALAGRFLAGALLGSRALQSLAAYASIATTSLAGTALAARSAGAALLAAFGGPVGLAITAITLAVGGLAYASRDTAASLAELEATAAGAESRLENAAAQAKRAGLDVDALKKSADGAKNSFNLLGTALGMAANKMADITNNARSAALATIALENAIARKAVNELGPTVATRDQIVDTFRRRTGGTEEQAISQAGVDNLEIDRARLAVAKQTLETNRQAESIIKALPPGVYKDASAGGSSSVAADGKKPKKGRAGASGPSAADIEQRFNAELASIAQQTLSSRQSMATSAEERAELELRSVELARVAALESVQADKDYSAAQKERVKDAIENLAEIERERVERDRIVQTEQEIADLKEARFQAESDALRNQYDLATTEDERRQIALRILEAEDAYLRAKLQAVIDSQVLSKAVKDQAQIAKDALIASAGDRRQLVLKANQGALDRYIEGLSDPRARAEEAVVRQLQEVNRGITDALSESLGVKNQFVKDLFSIFLDEVIFRPLAEAMRNQQGGGGGSGFFSSLLNIGTSLFGRASGGYVNGGTLYPVNEASSPGRVEGFMPTGSGTIIPLGQMNAMAARSSAQSGGVTTVRLALSGDIDARIDQRAAGVAIEVVRETAPQIADAGANLALSRASRPTI